MGALVTGATGKTGCRVVKALLGALGVAVGVTSRKPAPSRDGVTSVVFDWAGTGTWVGVASDADTMYMVGPGKFDSPGELVEALLVGLPGVKRVAALSEIEAGAIEAGIIDGNIWSNPWPDGGAVRRSGKEWTVVRSNWFYQSFNESPLFTGAMQARGKNMAPVGNGRVSFVDARDLAEVAAITMTTGGHDGKTYLLTGPETPTFGQVAAALTEADCSVSHADFAAQDMSAALTKQGVPLPAGSTVRVPVRADPQRTKQRDTDTVEELTGWPPRPFAALLSDELQKGRLTMRVPTGPPTPRHAARAKCAANGAICLTRMSQ